MVASISTPPDRIADDPFQALVKKMPKETYDLLVSNVDPSTVNAADLVIEIDCLYL